MKRHLVAWMAAAALIAAATSPSSGLAWGSGGSSGSGWTSTQPTATPAPTPTPAPASTPAQPAVLTAAQCVGCHGKATATQPRCECATAGCVDPNPPPSGPTDVCPQIADRHHALVSTDPARFQCTLCHASSTAAATSTSTVTLNLDCPSCHQTGGIAGGPPHDPATHAKWFQADPRALPGVQPQVLLAGTPVGCDPTGGASTPAAPTCGWQGFWTQAASYAPVSAADAQWRFCFQCHSSYGFGGSGVTAPSGFPFTDVAREFNPANLASSGATTAGGTHPVVAPVANDLGHTSNVLPPWNVGSVMLCSDCHAATSASVGLKGPNTRWDGSLTLGSSSGAFCFNCHGSFGGGSGSRYGGGSGVPTKAKVHVEHQDDHSRLQCWACHAAIPHGGPRPGMVVASAGASSAVGGVIPGWDQSSPYSKGTGTRFYIKAYPAAGQQWDKSNCGCNGTEHH